MRLKILATLLVLSAFVFPSGAAALAQPAASGQIVFSGTGGGTFGPFGFWIWCESADAQNPYHSACNGAMYFYALHIVKHVSGTVVETTEGRYTMTVTSGPAPSDVSCRLSNTTLMSGPNNTVLVSCTSPSGGGASTNAVVVATGP